MKHADILIWCARNTVLSSNMWSSIWVNVATDIVKNNFFRVNGYTVRGSDSASYVLPWGQHSGEQILSSNKTRLL